MDDTETVTYTIPTIVGELFYGEQERAEEAGHAFGVSLAEGEFSPPSDSHQSELASPFNEMPTTKPSFYVLDRENNDVQSRLATEDEIEHIAGQLNKSTDDLVAILNSDLSEIITYDLSGEGDVAASSSTDRLTPRPEDAPYRELTSDEIEGLSPEAVSVQSTCNDRLSSCAQAVGASSACIAGCVTAGVSTFGAAFAACAVCTGSFSFAGGVECGEYYNQCL